MSLGKPGIVRVELDGGHGGWDCTIYMTWDTYEASQFRPTPAQSLTAAIAQWRKHRTWVRKQRSEATVSRNLSNDPIYAMARQVEQDVADARASVERARSLSAQASRFYTDEADETPGVRPRQEAA